MLLHMLAEVVKNVRLTPQPLGVPRPSSPKLMARGMLMSLALSLKSDPKSVYSILRSVVAVLLPLFHNLILAGLFPSFVQWTHFFLSDKSASVVYQTHQNRSFRVRGGVLQGSVLGRVFFSFHPWSLYVSACLPSAALFMLTSWQSVPPPPTQFL